MRKSVGFTIVELVVVIVLLAILAAVALPRFLQATDSAMLGRLETVEGSLRSAAGLIHAQAAVENKLDGQDSITVDGASIELHSGYPRAHWMNAMRFMIRLDDTVWTPTGTVCDATWCGRGNQTSITGTPAISGLGAKIWPRGYQWSDQCAVYYINNEDGTEPLLGILSADC